LYRTLTSNLSKAHVTRDSIGFATWAICVGPYSCKGPGASVQ